MTKGESRTIRKSTKLIFKAPYNFPILITSFVVIYSTCIQIYIVKICSSICLNTSDTGSITIICVTFRYWYKQGVAEGVHRTYQQRHPTRLNFRSSMELEVQDTYHIVFIQTMLVFIINIQNIQCSR